jgi:phosphoribosylformylglycinamidine synthase
LDFKSEGDLIYLIGTQKDDIASSEFLYSYRGVKKSPAPAFDLIEEFDVQKAVHDLIIHGKVQSVHDVSDGGLFVALAESAMPLGLGFSLTTDEEFRTDAYLFGEAQSRVIVSVKPENKAVFEKYAGDDLKIPHTLIGKVTQSDFIIDGQTVITTTEAQHLFNTSLGEIFA